MQARAFGRKHKTPCNLVQNRLDFVFHKFNFVDNQIFAEYINVGIGLEWSYCGKQLVLKRKKHVCHLVWISTLCLISNIIILDDCGGLRLAIIAHKNMNVLMIKQKGYHFCRYFQMYLCYGFLLRSLKVVYEWSIDKLSLVQVMAWHWTDIKSLSEPMVTY